MDTTTQFVTEEAKRVIERVDGLNGGKSGNWRPVLLESIKDLAKIMDLNARTNNCILDKIDGFGKDIRKLQDDVEENSKFRSEEQSGKKKKVELMTASVACVGTAIISSVGTWLFTTLLPMLLK